MSDLTRVLDDARWRFECQWSTLILQNNVPGTLLVVARALGMLGLLFI
jgi:hypothetical protein